MTGLAGLLTEELIDFNSTFKAVDPGMFSDIKEGMPLRAKDDEVAMELLSTGVNADVRCGWTIDTAG